MAESLRGYLLLCRMWSRASLAYPASLLMSIGIGAVITGLDVVTIAVVFTYTRSLAGFALPEVLLLYGTASLALAIADLLLGSVERLGRHIRAGTFDVILIRPVGVLAQLAAEEFAVRRVGRVIQAGAVLTVALCTVHVPWTAGRWLMVAVLVVAGTVIFGAIFVLGAAFQFFAGDAAEVMNAFTYGGNTLTQYPLTVYGREAVRALTFVVPLAFVNWYPALYVLGRPDPFGWPASLRFGSPVVAAILAGLAGLAWRAGLRAYRSTGS